MKPENNKKKNKEAQRKAVTKKVMILIFAIMVVEGTLIVLFLARKQSEWNADEHRESVEVLDTDSFLQKYAEVLSVTDARASQSILTEKEAEEYLVKRGFTAYVECVYSMSGELKEETSDSGNTEHPMYTTYYNTSDGNLWTITIADDTIHAYPTFYNLDSELEVYVSEKDTVTVYNSENGQFYELKAKDGISTVIKVDRLDAQHLDNLTAKEIEKHVK